MLGGSGRCGRRSGGGFAHEKNGLGGTLEVYLYQGTPADGRVIR